MGGSTNTVLHVLALAREAEVDYPLARFNEVAERTPHLARSRRRGMATASGTCRTSTPPAAFPRSSPSWRKKPGTLDLDAPMVTGMTLGEQLAGVKNTNPDCIRPIDNPHSERGALCVLFGSLAPLGAVIKVGAVSQHEMAFRGPARVFDSEEAATSGDARRHPLGRRGRRAQRRPARRTGDARDAVAHEAAQGNADRRDRRADHRRTILRRHARTVHRPRVAGSRGGRTDRPHSRGRHHRDRSRRAKARRRSLRGRARARARNGGRRRRSSRAAGSRVTRAGHERATGAVLGVPAVRSRAIRSRRRSPRRTRRTANTPRRTAHRARTRDRKQSWRREDDHDEDATDGGPVVRGSGDPDTPSRRKSPKCCETLGPPTDDYPRPRAAHRRANPLRGVHSPGRRHDLRHSRRRDHAVLPRAARVRRPTAPRALPPRAGCGTRGRGLRARDGRVGVCVGTSGPGATNLVTPIADAWMDSTPIVAITGQVPSALLGTDAFQETDIIGITVPITKHSYLVRDAEDIPRVVAEAFYIAASGGRVRCSSTSRRTRSRRASSRWSSRSTSRATWIIAWPTSIRRRCTRRPS